jgi:hypothetical protein
MGLWLACGGCARFWAQVSDSVTSLGLSRLQFLEHERVVGFWSAKNGVFEAIFFGRCTKNGILGASALADGGETAFRVCRRWRMGKKRRFWGVGVGRWVRNGVLGVSALADGRKTPFLAFR